MDIIHAVYTSIADFSSDGNKGMDVTEKLQSLVDPKTKTITISAGKTFNELFGEDPEPYHPKILRVKYKTDDSPNEIVESILEVVRSERVLGNKAKQKTDEKPTLFHVERAMYGGDPQGKGHLMYGESGTKDVTEQVRAMIDHTMNNITFAKNVNFNKFFGGDPAPMVAKLLHIDYNVNGACHSAKLPEKRKSDIIIDEKTLIVTHDHARGDEPATA